MIGEVESVDEVEIIRRMTEGIYDRTEHKKALEWVKEKCRPDFDKNPVEMQKTPAQKEKDWEFTAKMAVLLKICSTATSVFLRAEKKKWSVITLSSAGSKVKDNGRIFTRTAISPKVFLTLRSTGTARENLTFSARKTTP